VVPQSDAKKYIVLFYYITLNSNCEARVSKNFKKWKELETKINPGAISMAQIPCVITF
jgi:hypothetical protein